jgi:hypothetical protein
MGIAVLAVLALTVHRALITDSPAWLAIAIPLATLLSIVHNGTTFVGGLVLTVLIVLHAARTPTLRRAVRSRSPASGRSPSATTSPSISLHLQSISRAGAVRRMARPRSPRCSLAHHVDQARPVYRPGHDRRRRLPGVRVQRSQPGLPGGSQHVSAPPRTRRPAPRDRCYRGAWVPGRNRPLGPPAARTLFRSGRRRRLRDDIGMPSRATTRKRDGRSQPGETRSMSADPRETPVRRSESTSEAEVTDGRTDR